MKANAVQSRVVSLVIAIVLLLQISPAPAGASSAGSPTQGSHAPGLPVPSTAKERNKHRGPVEITYAKWAHKNDDGTFGPLLEGFTGGDVAGSFVGEVLQRQVSQRQADTCFLPPPNCGRIIRLEALYEVQAGERSFSALIRGGTSGDTGAALLDGVILFGWRTGEPVHVAFQTTTNCPHAPDARTCFQGTITISPASED